MSLGIISLIGLSYFLMGYVYNKATLVSKYGQQLHIIAKERQLKIIAALEEQKKQSSVLAAHHEFISLFKAVSDSFAASRDYKNPDYKKEEVKLDHFFNVYKATFNYRDIILIQPDGSMFYTSKIDLPRQNNLLDLSYQKSALSQSFMRIRVTHTTDISEFAIEPVVKEPAIFVLQPVFYEQQFIGLLAVWIDEAVFYHIIQNYTDLGRTGDIFVTKNIGDRVLFVAPSRLYSNVAFKKITNPDKYVNTPARKASLGYEGHGYIIDSFDVKIISAWLFVPQVDWGLAVGIQTVELLTHIHILGIWFLILLSVFLACFAYFVIQHRRWPLCQRGFKIIKAAWFIRILLWILFCISMFISMYLVWNHYKTTSTIFNGTKELAQLKVRTEAEIINQYMQEIEKIGQMIAQDLHDGLLTKDTLALRIKRDLKELPDIESITIAYAPFAFDPKKRLYGIQAKREGEQIIESVITSDYMIPGTASNPEIGWYDRALKQGTYWSAPYHNPQTKKQEVIYAVPFYQKDSNKIEGVVGIIYHMGKILAHVRAIEIGKTGYAVILSSTGQFISHPLEQYVKEGLTLTQILKQQNNQALKDITEQIIKGENGFGSFYDQNAHVHHWIAYEPIKTVKWTIAAFFSDESLDLPIQRLHQQRLWILISLVILLLLLSMIACHLEHPWVNTLRKWSVLTSFLFLGALIVFWVMVRKTVYQPGPQIAVMRDKTNLDKYIEFLNLDAGQRNETVPIIIPTGIVLYTVSFPDSNRIAVSGYLWQKLTKESNASIGIRLPEAAEFHSSQVINKQENNEHIVGWNFNATFNQKHRYSWFPFDRVHVDITIASADFEHNVVLVPDFDGYQSIEIDPLPGITNKIAVPGFELERSFFSFTTLESYEEVGLESLQNATEKVRLHYNVILDRKLINPFVIFFVPLLIILFSIYAVFLITFKGEPPFNVSMAIGSYTGIFFSLVLLHQTLRSQYQAGELLYLEYFFFFIYVTILLLTLHAMILRVGHMSEFITHKITPYLKIFFWPIQFALWFGVTMIIFYVLR